MKRKLWILQMPILFLFTFCFWVVNQGETGDLRSAFLRDRIFPILRSFSGAFTNGKFRYSRGIKTPRNKIVIVAIDDQSLEAVGRWPWNREIQARLIDRIFASGAKVVGLDIVNSEAQERVPQGLADELRRRKLGELVNAFDSDGQLAMTTALYEDRLVLGWAADQLCQPAQSPLEECPVQVPEVLSLIPENYEKFAFTHFQQPNGFNTQRAPQISVLSFLSNLPIFNSVAKHAGSFNAFPDSDNYVRRVPLFMFSNGKPYPTLALEMARVGLKEDLRLKMNTDYKVNSVEFSKSGNSIPVTPMGVMEINFRGPSRTFEYVSAVDLLAEKKTLEPDGMTRKIASLVSDIFKDAYVLVGATAVGIYDMRAFPFDSNTPGVEGHANILDNILSLDPLIPSTSGSGYIWIFILMTLGALIFGVLIERLESVPGLIFFGTTMFLLGVVDLKVLFNNNINWNTSFLMVQYFTLFVFTVAAKYILEEQDKKFLKSAFGKYVAPALVDSIVKDPSKLSLGGDKKELTILFSDIRGFTTLSEKMDAKHLAKFLNEYLGRMTKIIFENRGTLDKYIGDAIMGFWGAPLDQKDHAANCCKAAIQMMEALAQDRKHFLEAYGVDIQIGIGINSGLVSVGNMGSKDNFNYTVIGDHVNLASRLEGLTKHYGAGVITSRFTLDSITGSGLTPPRYRILDKVKVKGKKQAVELIQILDSEMSEEGIKAFEEGRQQYLAQQWDSAMAKFLEAQKLFSPNLAHRDGPCTLYIERCEEFKKLPPSSDWDGSWEMHSK